jgi:RimJ/RimL family protein N-acetyltransferase
MSRGLLIGEDQQVAKWAFEAFRIFPAPINQALGLIDNVTGKIVGAVIFQNFNGMNIELSYYGPRTVTYGIVRAVARVALNGFNVARLTVVTSKKNRRLMRGLLKIGFKLEGHQRCYYGHEDNNKNTGVRFVMFREHLKKLANSTPRKIPNAV